jgi:hypothetical protein
MENPTWKLPERRVAKFLKKELKANSIVPPDDVEGANDDDDSSVVSTNSAASFMKKAGSLRKIFSPNKAEKSDSIEKKGFFRGLKSFRNKKQEKEQAAEYLAARPAPVAVVTAPRVKQAEEEQEAPQPRLLFPEEPDQEADEDVMPTESAPISGDVIYQDDNDGKHEPALCGGCVIL